VGAFGAATSAGFDPVGQVFGATVAYLGPAGLGRCFVPGGSTRRDGQTSADPYNALLGKLVAARKLAFERAVEECRALGGDGIIGMRAATEDFFTDTVKFTVQGTAVRARAQTRPETPFTTHVSGQDLARLLDSGRMPFALVFGMAIAACHFDDTMFRQTRRGVGAAGNREVSGYTRLVNDARRQARRELEDAVRERRGEGAVVHEATLRFSERECPLFNQRVDYLAEATILGSAIVSLGEGAAYAARPPMTIMRLDARSEKVAEQGAEAGTEPMTGARTDPKAEAEAGSGPGPDTLPRPGLSDRAFAYRYGRRPKW
jgi:uncharacterized protein YbjQ (UPF0145 family)